jgi:hypothetical protein
MHRMLPVCALLVLLSACAVTSTEPPPPTGPGLFTGGCPEPGHATARFLTDAAERPSGADALAEPGDVMLMNEVAAFVIQAPDNPRTYYHYGGIPVDAVPVAGCGEAGPDQFGEMGFVLGTLDVLEFDQSTLRMFRGESAEIVADGSDSGPAIVDVHGVDDTFWLVEMTLITSAYQAGRPKPRSSPYGIDVTVRYTLAPNDPVLSAELIIEGTTGGGDLLSGLLLFPSDHSRKSAFSAGEISFGGFHLATGTPWTSFTGDSSYAVAHVDGNGGITEVAGVQAYMDVGEALAPTPIGPGDVKSSTFLLSVVPGSEAPSAPLLAHEDELAPGMEGTRQPVAGRVLDPLGEPVEDAEVELLCRTDGDWAVADRFLTEDGAFDTAIPALVGVEWALRASSPGRDRPTEVAGAATLDLPIGPRGSLRVSGSEEGGSSIPVRVRAVRDDGLVRVAYVTPKEPMIDLPPGAWDVTASRGYEYSPVTAAFFVPSESTVEATFELPRPVDTAGWISVDTHVHAGPSADSDTLPEARMKTAAAAGLDVVVSSDHEAIVDLSAAVLATGLSPYLHYALGEEITPPFPEHHNAWPFPVRAAVRGESVRWMTHGMAEIHALTRQRGAEIIQLNHPRVNGSCGILCLLDWDRMSAAPGEGIDPGDLGVDDAIWSWDFDAMEVMNDTRDPFLWPDDTRHSGAFNDWIAMLNLGHRVTAFAVTDVHGLELPGLPRTYLRVADDDPATVQDAALVEATLGGHAQISAGAFARVAIGDAGPGDLAAGGEVSVAIRVDAIPEIDVQRAIVLVNGDLAAQVLADDPHGVVKIDTVVPLSIDADAHVVVLAFGDEPLPIDLLPYDDARVPRVLVNPVFVDGDGDGVFTAPGAKACDWIGPD